MNGTYTTATQPTSGHILILGSEAQNTGALADAVPECPDGNTIRFFVRNWQYAPAFRQNSRSGGTKTAGAVTMSFYQVAVHEIGHVLGMDHASGDSIMQANPMPFGLAWDDINGMRSGTCSTTGTDSGGNSITCANCTLISGTTYDCGFGVATSKTMHAMYSNNDGTSWSEDHSFFVAPAAATNIEASHTFGYNNSGSGSPKYGIAYVRATTAGDDKVRVISGSGSTWPSDVDTGGVSTFGPAIAYGNTGSGNNTGFWVVAYVDRNSSPSNLLKYTIAQDPSGTWSTPATVNVGTQDQRAVGRPYLTYSPSSGFFVLAWADENSAQITTATGYPASGAIAWSNRTVTGGLDFTGGAVACVAGTGTPSGVGDCLMAWPHPGQDFPIMSARAWTDPTFSNIKVSPAKRAATDSTISGLGVALKPNASSGGAALAMLAARALGNPLELDGQLKVDDIAVDGLAQCGGADRRGDGTLVWRVDGVLAILDRVVFSILPVEQGGV